MPAVSSVSFLTFIHVFMKLLVPFLITKIIKNINSFVSRGLYTLMLASYIHHICVCSIPITLIDDIEKNLGPILKETYLNSSISSNNIVFLVSSNGNNLTIPDYDLYRADPPSNIKQGEGGGEEEVVTTIKFSSVESNLHSIRTSASTSI